MRRLAFLITVLLFLFIADLHAQTEWTCGDTETIEWTSSDDIGIEYHKVEYSIDAGDTWTLLTNPTGDGWVAGDPGEYSWNPIPETPTWRGRVKVSWKDAAGNVGFDISDTNFILSPSATDLKSYIKAEFAIDSTVGVCRAVDTDGTYVYSCGVADAIAYVIAHDPDDLTEQYTYTYEDPDHFTDPENPRGAAFNSLDITADGGLIVCGVTYTQVHEDPTEWPDANGRLQVVKLPFPSGGGAWTPEWSQIHAHPTAERGYGLSQIVEIEEDWYVAAGMKQVVTESGVKRHAWLWKFSEASRDDLDTVGDNYFNNVYYEDTDLEETGTSWFSGMMVNGTTEADADFICVGGGYIYDGGTDPEDYYGVIHVAWIDEHGAVQQQVTSIDPGETGTNSNYEGRGVSNALNGYVLALGFGQDGYFEIPNGAESRYAFQWEVPIDPLATLDGDYETYNYTVRGISSLDRSQDAVQMDVVGGDINAFVGYATISLENKRDYWLMETDTDLAEVVANGSTFGVAAPTPQTDPPYGMDFAYGIEPVDNTDPAEGYYIGGGYANDYDVKLVKPFSEVITYASWVAAQDNLLLWLRLDDPIGDELEVTDSSGSVPAHHGIMENDGPSIESYANGLVADDSNNAMEFFDQDDSVNITDASLDDILDGAATLTIEFMTYDFDISSNGCLFNKGGVGGLTISVDSANGYARLYMGGVSNTLTTPVYSDWGDLHVWAFVFDGSQSTNQTKWKLYKDGSPVTWGAENGTIDIILPTNTNPMQIGKYTTTGSEIDGVLDEFKIYSDAKSAAWALESYNYATQ